jgi:hypothetical protein
MEIEMRLYLARPITGCSFDEVASYYEETRDILQDMGYEVFFAFCGKNYLKNENEFKATGYEQPLSTDHAIVERDRWMTQISDVVFVNFNECNSISIGCVAEIIWAKDRGKHVVVVMDKKNVHWHSFILESASVIYPTYNEAIDYLEKLAKMEI